MSDPTTMPPYDRLLATADRVARERPEVDADLAREVFEEAATLLHDGLALDGLDEHDAAAVVDYLCEDLVAPDPGAAIRARAETVQRDPGALHDPRNVGHSLAVVLRIFQL